MLSLTTRRLRLDLLLLVSLFILLPGCGGGGAGGGGGGGGGGSTDARGILLNEIAAKFEAFDGANPDQENQQLLDFIRTKSEFVESGLSDDGGVWGRFADDTLLVIANNVSRFPTRAPRVTRSARSARGRLGLPTTDKVIIGTSFGTFFDAANAELSPMFTNQNYSILDNGASVETLKSFSDLGVLYLTTHGVSAPIRRGAPPTFIAWTANLRARDGSTDRTYSADLRDGSMAYFMALTFNGDENSIVRRAEVHYGITPAFVTKYWTGKFNPNSLVFMNACSSASERALQFMAAVISAGASVYVGWTDTMVIRDGIVSAAYLFDRLLGANSYDPESPPQRPFSWAPVMAAMSTHKRPYNAQMYDATVNPKTGLTAKLLFFPGSGNFQQLAPTIDAMSVDEQKDELTLVGFFGSVKGDVYMNDAPLTIKDWTIGRITCDLPRSGAGSSGDVNVRAGTPRQLSNTVQLTEWNGTITCTLDGKGSLKQEWVFAVRFRADVHDSRLQPHADPIPRLSGFTHNLTTNGSHTCSGIYAAPDGSYRETWSGSGSVPTFIRPPVGTPPGPVTGVALSGSFDPDRKWSLQIDATVLNGNQVRRVTYDSQGNVTSDTTTDEHAVWISVGDMIGSPYLATASTGFSIPGGAVRNQINADESMEITWSTMPAKNPPTANAARKVDRR